MQTFLYNLDTNERTGPIRDGYFTIDGVRPILPDNVVEIEIINIETPIYDPQLQRLNYREYLDLPNRQYIKGYEVINLTQEEIDNLNSLPDPTVPETCTPRQFRLSLLDFGIDPDLIDQTILSIPDLDERKRIQIIWEYSNSIERNDPLINQFAQLLNVPSQTVDDIFRIAVTYE